MAFGESIMPWVESCFAQEECSHCANTEAPDTAHTQSPIPSSTCCPKQVAAALEVDCICQHTPGAPVGNSAMGVPVSATSQLVAIPASFNSWNDDWVGHLVCFNISGPPRGASVACSGLFLRNMSFRI